MTQKWHIGSATPQLSRPYIFSLSRSSIRKGVAGVLDLSTSASFNTDTISLVTGVRKGEAGENNSRKGWECQTT